MVDAGKAAVGGQAFAGHSSQKLPAEVKRPRRAIRVGRETSVVLGSSADDLEPPAVADHGAAASNSNDERLKRDVPPHWQ